MEQGSVEMASFAPLGMLVFSTEQSTTKNREELWHQLRENLSQYLQTPITACVPVGWVRNGYNICLCMQFAFCAF